MILLALLCISQLWPVKAEFELQIQDLAFNEINGDFFDKDHTYFTVSEDSDGLSSVSTRVVFKKELPSDTIMDFDIMGYSQGAYDQSLGLAMSEPICVAFNDTMLVRPFIKFMKLDPDVCPPKVGTYGEDNYRPNQDQMPDTFMDGQYCVIIILRQQKEILLKLSIFIDITT